MIDEAWVNKVEASMFRTNHDFGAGINTLVIWNMVREQVGLPELTHRDLSQRHADDRGITIEEQLADEVEVEKFMRKQHYESCRSREAMDNELV